MAEEAAKDPFLLVEHIKLENGLNVYLAPSKDAKLLDLRLEVDVGTDAEHGRDIGVSHLLEHVLFRDKQLQDEMSYLQLIKEAGGQANGTTENRKTSFFASIPRAKGNWLVETFAKMLLEPKIGDDYVKKEKSTVELERGRPGPLDEVLQFDIMKIARPKYLKQPSFWESEFDVSFEDTYTLTEERLSTPRLTTEQVRQHYQDYYYPSNMRLFITGNFDHAKIMSQIKANWASLPLREGKKLASVPAPKPRDDEFKRIVRTDSTPYVYLGTKVWGLTLEESEVISSYVEYLAHRLMKEVRNLKGQTYTASGSTHFYRGFGYAILEFQTSEENFKDNVQLAHAHIEKETQSGSLSDEEVKESIKLYMAQYGLMGRESSDMMKLAQITADVSENFGSFTSPYATLASMSPEKYNAILKKYFTAKHSYEFLYCPPLLFRYDAALMSILIAITTFIVLRRTLTKKFANDKVRWIRKVKYPPLKALEIGTGLIACFAFMHVNYFMDAIATHTNLVQAPLLFSNYLLGALWIIVMLAFVQIFVSSLPRKLMVMDDALVIKSLSYYSKHVPLSEIASIELARANPFAVGRWWRVKHRFAFYNPRFWQQGLLLNLKSGESHFFSVSSPAKAASELRGFMTLRETLRTERVSNGIELAG
jgi:zinc protease